MAGVLDMYVYSGNRTGSRHGPEDGGMGGRYADSLSYEHMQRVLGTEYGGMGEVLCNLYAVTGKREYLDVAQRFDKKAVLRSAWPPTAMN